MAATKSDPLWEAVVETIAGNGEMVRRWTECQPGAWGYLAGQGILAYRRKLGRRLFDEERHALWQSLWFELDQTFGKRDS